MVKVFVWAARPWAVSNIHFLIMCSSESFRMFWVFGFGITVGESRKVHSTWKTLVKTMHGKIMVPRQLKLSWWRLWVYKLVSFKSFKSITDQSPKSCSTFHHLWVQIFPQAHSAVPRHTPNEQICSPYFLSLGSTFPQMFIFPFSPNIQKRDVLLLFCLRLRKKSDGKTMTSIYAGISCGRLPFLLTGK